MRGTQTQQYIDSSFWIVDNSKLKAPSEASVKMVNLSKNQPKLDSNFNDLTVNDLTRATPQARPGVLHAGQKPMTLLS